MQAEVLFAWEILEHEPRPKSLDWSWVVGILGGAIAIAAFVLGNILFGVFIVIATFSIILYGHKEPDLLMVDISRKGVRVNKEFFPYPTLDSFWIDDERGYPVLTILSKERNILPHIRVPIPHDLNTDDLLDMLLNYLDEDYHPPTFTESLVHFFQF